jgi:hypothetical protein
VCIVDVDGAVQVSKPLTGWNGVGEGFGGEGGMGGGWTISTGQPAGTPRQLVEAGFVVACADGFPAAAPARGAGAVAPDAGGWASRARCADSPARRLVPVAGPPGGDAGADWAVDTVPAGARRSV